jgi:hypothetical protein
VQDATVIEWIRLNLPGLDASDHDEKRRVDCLLAHRKELALASDSPRGEKTYIAKNGLTTEDTEGSEGRGGADHK